MKSDTQPVSISRRQWLRGTGAWSVGSSAWLALGVQAAVLMELEQAQRLLWAGAERFQPMALSLGEREWATIAQQSETRVPKAFSPRVWAALSAGKRLGWVIADRVMGKYDLIDYAVGFEADGVVTGVEILAYRESHGGEIRQAGWRRQFKGRKGPQSLRFADDIKNISGATLSCQHVTEGVQRLSALVSLLGTAS
jgi:hypothetical protein